MLTHKKGHNPYFNRWFSAILNEGKLDVDDAVTILILIDGFLQWKIFMIDKKLLMNVTILILIDGFLQ